MGYLLLCYECIGAEKEGCLIAMSLLIIDSVQSILYVFCENGDQCLQSEIYK